MIVQFLSQTMLLMNYVIPYRPSELILNGIVVPYSLFYIGAMPYYVQYTLPLVSQDEECLSVSFLVFVARCVMRTFFSSLFFILTLPASSVPLCFPLHVYRCSSSVTKLYSSPAVPALADCYNQTSHIGLCL